MDKGMKKHILLIAIIVSIAILFVPIYFFVLADDGDDNKFKVNNAKIIEMVDGTDTFDSNDDVGNDSSGSNNRVRTFDSIRYTVEYTLNEKVPQSTSQNIEGRKVLVEVLLPTQYEAVLRYDEENSVKMNETSTDIVTIEDKTYYYGSFEAPVAALGTPSSFNFSLNDINTSDMTNYNVIKPLIFIKEKTDNEVASVKTVSTLPTDITCDRAITVIDPNTHETSTSTSNDCNVTITGKEEYFVNMYVGNKKENQETNTKTIPVGLLIGLRNDPNKGIKGLIIPKDLSFNITNSNPTKLSFNENSERTYKTSISTDDYKINVEGNEMPEINNGDISSSINDGVLTINVNNIKDYLLNQYNDNFYYFSTNYFLTTLEARSAYDYSDITVTLTSSKNNSLNTESTVQIFDSFDYTVGNYLSNIDVFESSLISENSSEALESGKAIINYGGDFTLRTNFAYDSRENSTGDGLTNLTNYIKIDNEIFELHNDTSNNSYKFAANEISSTPSIRLDADEESHNKVYFGFGEWNANYFEATNADGCPTIDFNNKEQLMNLYGGPCLVEKSNVQWAFSPVSEHDITGADITSTNGPLIVKSTFVSYNDQYIKVGSAGSIELYGTIKNDYTKANKAYIVTTNGTALGRDRNDLRYLGYETLTGESLMSNPNNFVKTNYDFDNRVMISNNSNLCSIDRCPVNGTTILVSGIKSTRPSITAHKAIDLSKTESQFYYYPLALKINSNASKNDKKLSYDTIYVDLYLPSYMNVVENYGIQNEKVPSSIDTTNLSSIYYKMNKGTPANEVNYKVYHYIITAETQGLTEDEIINIQQGILSNFVIYVDIDSIATPNAIQPEIFTTVDFKASMNLTNNDGSVTPITFRPISTTADRSNELNNITLYNSSAVITKATANPKHIEKNGSYTFNMLAYNHSASIVENGYVYPTAELYYVLPYNGDLSSELSSKIGTTKYKVNFTSESISAINTSDYKFYYATTGTPANIIADEIKTTSDPSSIWNLWEDPTTPVSNVLAVKVVKQTPFDINTYFGSEQGLSINIEAVGSSDGDVFYNSFHILASKPDNYSCENIINDDGEIDPNYCNEAKQNKINYASSSSVTSIYAREISGFVFEDFDYNGIYTQDESKLKDIPVSLYKIDQIPENYDSTDPTTFVKDTDKLVGATVTGENGNYYFGGLSSGIYYVSYTIDNTRYIVTDLEKKDESIPDSINNNSKGSLLPNTNKAISSLVVFPQDFTGDKISFNNINLGLAIKKEMAISLNKYITEVTVSKNGKVDTYDYSNQNLSQVSITVLNPKDTKIRVKYSFSIENTKYFPGYVGMIIDSMPQDMTFDPNLKENQYWVMYDNLLYYNGLSGKLLLPNEKQYFTLVLDLNLKEAGTYKNIISAKDITLMGEELPVYDFSGLINNSNNTSQGGE